MYDSIGRPWTFGTSGPKFVPVFLTIGSLGIVVCTVLDMYRN